MAKEIVGQDKNYILLRLMRRDIIKLKENIKKSGLDNIVSIKGDAVEEIKKIEENFDLFLLMLLKGIIWISLRILSNF